MTALWSSYWICATVIQIHVFICLKFVFNVVVSDVVSDVASEFSDVPR